MDELTLEVNTRNRDPRAACVLLVDVSGSMSGEPIRELESGFAQFTQDIKDDPLARKRAEVAVVTFGSEANLLVPFQEGRDLEPAQFSINGSTNMAAGINMALDEIEARKRQYREAGLEYFRPWIFLLTDGGPDRGPAFEAAVQRLRAVEGQRGVTVFSVGVGSQADFDTLSRLSQERPPLALKGLQFAEMFSWLSNSMKAVSSSNNSGGDDTDLQSHTEQIPLAPPGWGTVI